MTDERAGPDNGDEIESESETEGQAQGGQDPQQEAAYPSRKAAARRARPGDEGTRLLRRVIQLEPPGLRRRPLELFLPHGGPGHRRHGTRKSLPVRVPGGPLPVAREPSPATPVPIARPVRSVRAVRRRDRVRAARRAPPRPPLHQVQSEVRRSSAPLTAACSGGPRPPSSRRTSPPSSPPQPR